MVMEDYDQVYRLWSRTEGLVLTDADERDVVARYLQRNPGISHIADVCDRVVGAALCGHDGRRGLLHHLAVDAKYRGRGLGRSLVNACLQALASANISRCNIFIVDEHTQGREFWQHHGWLPSCRVGHD